MGFLTSHAKRTLGVLQKKSKVSMCYKKIDIPKRGDEIMTNRELLEAALTARHNAYAPYSDFAVGAALLAADGRVFLGCNVENACYPAGTCAERAALYSAISAGAREFTAIAVTGGQRDHDGSPCMPCGICRQALYEFTPDLRIVTGTPSDVRTFSLMELFPYGFGL